MGETLFKNNVSGTPFWATPIYFYLLFLAIKVPLPVIIASVVGLVVCINNWRNPAHGFVLLMFALWIVPYSLMGAKWLRFTLSLMPFVYMMAAVGVVSMLQWASLILKRNGVERARIFAYGMVFLFFIALPAWTAYAGRPHYALYTNSLAGKDAAGFYFPHDEFYDDGLREAIKYICDNAPQGAFIVNETPGVVRYYLQRNGRPDLQQRVLSDPRFNIDPTQENFVILQRGRTYFENIDKMKAVRERFRFVYASCPIRHRPSAEVWSARSGDVLVKVCEDINL
jgi:hypothetical protein